MREKKTEIVGGSIEEREGENYEKKGRRGKRRGEVQQRRGKNERTKRLPCGMIFQVVHSVFRG